MNERFNGSWGLSLINIESIRPRCLYVVLGTKALRVTGGQSARSVSASFLRLGNGENTEVKYLKIPSILTNLILYQRIHYFAFCSGCRKWNQETFKAAKKLYLGSGGQVRSVVILRKNCSRLTGVSRYSIFVLSASSLLKRKPPKDLLGAIFLFFLSRYSLN